MNSKPSNKNHLLLKAALIVAALSVLTLCIMLVTQYQHIKRLDYIAQHPSIFRSLRGSWPLSASNASSTQSWMTFDYLNHVFSLPPTYFQMALSITDSRYPRLTIQEYAEDAGLSQAATLAKVQDSISSYSAGKQ